MTILDTKVDELKALDAEVEVSFLERSAQYRLSDAIRSGSRVTEQSTAGWTDAEGNLCTLSTAVVDAKARGYL